MRNRLHKALGQKGEVEPRLEIMERNLPRHRTNRRDQVRTVRARVVTESGGSPKVSGQQTGVPGKPWLEFPPLSASFALEGTHHKGGHLVSQSQSVMAGRATL